MKRYLAVAALAVAPLVCAQVLKLDVLERLKARASNATDVNLNKDLLTLGAGVLGGDKDNGDKIKKLAAGLDSVLVRSLEFDKEGAYSDADVKQLASELSGPGWNLIVSADEKKEKSRIWIKSGGAGDIGGVRVLSAEQKELTVVEIVGKIHLEDLKDLKALGIPNLNIGSEHTGKPAKKDEE